MQTLRRLLEDFQTVDDPYELYANALDAAKLLTDEQLEELKAEIDKILDKRKREREEREKKNLPREYYTVNIGFELKKPGGNEEDLNRTDLIEEPDMIDQYRLIHTTYDAETNRYPNYFIARHTIKGTPENPQGIVFRLNVKPYDIVALQIPVTEKKRKGGQTVKLIRGFKMRYFIVVPTPDGKVKIYGLGRYYDRDKWQKFVSSEQGTVFTNDEEIKEFIRYLTGKSNSY